MAWLQRSAFVFCVIASFFVGRVHAQRMDKFASQATAREHYLDSFERSVNYQTDKINIKSVAELNVPAGYKFIPGDKADMIVHDLWRNPKRGDVLGMIVKSDYTIIAPNEWAFVITYEESGYVKDKDADKIDYDELLKKIHDSEPDANKERVKQGYPTVHVVGWATAPHYDKENKVLHWAREIQFGDDSTNMALNYDVRVLGRKGILSLNAVGKMNNLNDIEAHIPDVLKMAKFTSGNQYADFNSSIDKVAAYTIGGLIAGNLIAKTGLFILLLKYIKLIAFAFLGGFTALRKKIAGLFGKKKKTTLPVLPVVEPVKLPVVDDTEAGIVANDEPTDKND